MSKNETLDNLRQLHKGQFIEMTSEYDVKHSSDYACYLSKGDKLFCRIETVLKLIIIKRVR